MIFSKSQSVRILIQIALAILLVAPGFHVTASGDTTATALPLNVDLLIVDR